MALRFQDCIVKKVAETSQQNRSPGQLQKNKEFSIVLSGPQPRLSLNSNSVIR